MSWFFYALAGPAIWAFVNHLDKFVINRFVGGKEAGSLVIFTGLSGFIFSILIFLFKLSALGISYNSGFIIAINGALLVAAFIPYIYAMSNDDTSNVVTLYQLIPVFGYFLGLIFLHEQLSGRQLFGSMFIIIGAIIISLDFSAGIKIKFRNLFLMALSSFMVALNGLIFKIIAINENFWGTAFWEYIGGFVFSILLFVGISSYRRQFVDMIRENRSIIGISFVTESLNMVAKLFASFASLLAPLVLVWVVNGFQPVFVLFYGIILTLFFPHIYKEDISKKLLLQKLISIFIIIAGTYLLFK